MPIQVVNPTVEVDEDTFEVEGGDEGTEYNMRELMDQVYQHRDLIITVPTDQVPALKQGLSVRKTKDNAKLKNADIRVTADVLNFLVYPAKDKEGKELEGISDVRIKLGPKRSVTVFDIRIPDDL